MQQVKLSVNKSYRLGQNIQLEAGNMRPTRNEWHQKFYGKGTQ